MIASLRRFGPLSHHVAIGFPRRSSFIDSGRSVPGRDRLLPLAQHSMCCCACAMPCCSLTGYAPVYPEAPWNAPEMHSVISALERVVCQHEPFPAIAMDRHWNVLMTNDAAPRFFDIAAARNGPRNMLLLIFDPRRMPPIRGRLGHCFTKLPATRASARQHLMLCRGNSEPDNSLPQLAAIRHIATVSPPEWCERPTTRERPLQFETCRSPHIVPKGRNGSVWCVRRRPGIGQLRPFVHPIGCLAERLLCARLANPYAAP